ncbi:MAG: hypothetical protein MZV49_06085 [Rhodopseudomonas palustris]|nr:hypothetical protein [Rhodopseudomonas palustris]
MELDGVRDLRAVLFPPILMTFFIVAFALPGLAAARLGRIAERRRGCSSPPRSAYFLNYEFLHLAYHLPASHPIARWPLIGRLKSLHQAHHDPRLMTPL